MRAWFDGKLVVDRDDVVLRSTDFPDMKFNQLLLAPYFGPGLLPHEQTLWIDELVVGTERLGCPIGLGSRSAKSTVRIAAAQPQEPDDRLPAGARRGPGPRRSVAARIWSGSSTRPGTPAATPWRCRRTPSACSTGKRRIREASTPCFPRRCARMLDRLGRAAAEHRMNLVLCSDVVEPDGRSYNTAFLLGRDGREIGRYRKVNLPLGEQARTRGDSFPVFPTPNLGSVGMLICYDMVFPEAARCLALRGADVIMHPTLGGAAFGDDDISLAAFRTRAAENLVYLVVARRSQGSMIISPRGKVLATADGPDALAIAEIDPAGGREGGDAFNTQTDLRGRIFRERVPGAYGLLTDPQPPVLAKVPSNVTRDQAIRITATVLTTGEQRFNEAAALAREGKTEEAIRLFEQLCEECPTSWIDRLGRERLKALRKLSKADAPGGP